MKHLRLGGLSRLRLSRYREASGADDPITRWDMRLPMDATIYRGLEEILGKRSGEEALPKIHATSCNSFQVSVSSYDMQLSFLTTIGSYWISALAMKSAGCGRSFGRIGWSRCWTLGTGCSGHWAWSSSSDRCPIVLRDPSNKTWKSHDACSSEWT